MFRRNLPKKKSNKMEIRNNRLACNTQRSHTAWTALFIHWQEALNIENDSNMISQWKYKEETETKGKYKDNRANVWQNEKSFYNVWRKACMNEAWLWNVRVFEADKLVKTHNKLRVFRKHCWFGGMFFFGRLSNWWLSIDIVEFLVSPLKSSKLRCGKYSMMFNDDFM